MLRTRMHWWPLILICAACGSKDTAPAPVPEPPVGPQRSTQLGIDRLPQPAIALPHQQSFRVLDPGTGARAPLGYALDDGETTTRIEMTLTSRHMDGVTWSASTTLPPIRTALVVSIDSGQLRVRPLAGEVVGAASVDAQAYLSAWRALENRRLAVGFDARGQLGAIVFADDPSAVRSREAIDDLTQRLLSIIVPVPAEPVGIGAKWRVVTVLDQRPVVVKQTATYTLLEMAPSGWKIDVDIQRIGEAQTIADRAVDDDTMVELVALVRRYHGTVEVSAARPLPTGTLEIVSSMHLRLQPRTGPVTEQILEDKGTVVFALVH